ncbi:hypothetical protein TNCV_4611101 [Trichonephila clavipes]|nr:hypothetical protein TNCV_4611101 [Trichonephila clavipes]
MVTVVANVVPGPVDDAGDQTRMVLLSEIVGKKGFLESPSPTFQDRLVEKRMCEDRRKGKSPALDGERRRKKRRKETRERGDGKREEKKREREETEKEKKRDERERGDGKREEKESGEREEPALDGEKG